VNLIEVVNFREGAGGGDLEDSSDTVDASAGSHAVKSAIGSHRESCAEGVLPVRSAEAVERAKCAGARYAEHRPEVVGSAGAGSSVILSAGPSVRGPSGLAPLEPVKEWSTVSALV
jgi:hypothetical protein